MHRFVRPGRAVLTLAVLVLGSGCGTLDAANESTASGESCADSNLIAQCPPGSDPILEASAVSMCEGSAEFSGPAPSSDGAGGSGVLDDLEGVSGKVEGVCKGSGECHVYCQFQVPCDCGVDQITDDGIFCTKCIDTAACGNRKCEGTETPESCPNDCAAVCRAGEARCNGEKLRVCEGGQFVELSCAANETCKNDAVEGASCQRSGL